MKTLTVILLSAIILSCSHKSTKPSGIQEFQPKDSIPSIIKEEEPQQDEPYTFVEQMPSFPGGEAELYRFLINNLHYPKAANELAIQGRIVVKFVVTKTGDIKDIQGIKDDIRSDSLIAAIKRMPRWIPGKQNGKEVDVYFTLPLHISPQRE